MMDASHLPLLLFDDGLYLIAASRAFHAAFGWIEARDGRALADLGGGAWDTPQVRGLLEGALANGGQAGGGETDLLTAGAETRRLVLKARAVDENLTPDRWILLTVDDVTRVRESEGQIATLMIEKDELLGEREMLHLEMQHRIANSLQTIASVLQLKARAAGSDEARRQLLDAHARVMAVAAVQRHLELGAGLVDVGPYLEKLCESLESSVAGEYRTTRITVQADPALVTSHVVTSLGLIVAELVINALKHAFPDGRDGGIQVEYRAGPQGWRLSVSDDGIGRPPPGPDQRVGLGTGVVNALARQLHARVELEDVRPGSRLSLIEIVPAPEAGAAPPVV